MLLKNGFVAVSAMVLMTLPSAMGQYGGAAGLALAGADAGIVIGQPFALVEKFTDVTPLADGTKITRHAEELKWRDSQGRFRKEMTTFEEGQAPVYLTATIIDPVNNTVTTLHMDLKTASVVHLQAGQLRPYAMPNDSDLMARQGVQVKVEKLDGKTIAGVYAVGRRVTRTRPPGTIGNDKTVVSVSEKWVSPDLKTVLLDSMDDPREQGIHEVTQLNRGDPDASLFEIPADYTVKEAVGRPIPGR
jgi:hypothetical protein